MKFLIWNEDVMARSFEFLKKLKALDIDFVLIGGWAVYFLTKYHMSRDIDLIIQDKELWKLKKYVISFGGREKIGELKKTGFHIENVDIDVYSETQTNLAIPIKDMFKNKMYLELDGIKILMPEPLLLLKLKAVESRGFGIKGLKDRCDILALCLKRDVNFSALKQLAKKYGISLDKLKEIILSSGQEFDYVFQSKQAPNKIRKIKQQLIAKLVVQEKEK